MLKCLLVNELMYFILVIIFKINCNSCLQCRVKIYSFLWSCVGVLWFAMLLKGARHKTCHESNKKKSPPAPLPVDTRFYFEGKSCVSGPSVNNSPRLDAADEVMFCRWAFWTRTRFCAVWTSCLLGGCVVRRTWGFMFRVAASQCQVSEAQWRHCCCFAFSR